MKRILYIRPNNTNITGGVKVNKQIYGEMKKIKDIEIIVKDNQYYWENQSSIIKKLPSFVESFMFNFKYLAHKNEFALYDYIFVDSRLYPRLFVLVNNIKKNRNIKIITTHHHFCYLQQQNPIKKIIHRIIETNFLKNTDKILTFSKYTYDTAKYIGIDEDKLSLDELGFEQEVADNIYEDRASKELLFIGTVEPRKGLEYLIKAIDHIKEKHPDIKVHIVGRYNPESGYYRKLVRLVKEYNLSQNKFMSLLSAKRGAGILSDEVHLILVNKDLGVITFDVYKKDKLPYKLFQYGSIQFPKGQEDQNSLVVYPCSVKEREGSTVIYDI